MAELLLPPLAVCARLSLLGPAQAYPGLQQGLAKGQRQQVVQGLLSCSLQQAAATAAVITSVRQQRLAVARMCINTGLLCSCLAMGCCVWLQAWLR